MPIGVYKHHSQQGFQPGHTINLGIKKPNARRPSGLKYKWVKEGYEKNVANLKAAARRQYVKRMEFKTCPVCRYMFLIPQGNARKGYGKFCSSKCYGESMRSTESPSPRRAHSSARYYDWRVEVLRRDGYKCVKCGNNKALHAHHIVPTGVCVKWAYYVWNGITFCDKCHYEIHRRYKR